jgi:hypothetical protein
VTVVAIVCLATGWSDPIRTLPTVIVLHKYSYLFIYMDILFGYRVVGSYQNLTNSYYPTHTFMYLHMHIYMHIKQNQSNTHMYKLELLPFTFVNKYIYIYVYKYVHIYINVYLNIYKYIYIYTYTNISKLPGGSSLRSGDVFAILKVTYSLYMYMFNDKYAYAYVYIYIDRRFRNT